MSDSTLAQNSTGEISTTKVSFHYKLFPKKTDYKIFQKIKIKLFLRAFWALFKQIWAKMNFSGKKGCQFLNTEIIYHQTKIKKKINEPSLRKTTKLMEGQTDGQ